MLILTHYSTTVISGICLIGISRQKMILSPTSQGGPMVDEAKTGDLCNYNTLRYKCGMCKYKPEEILKCRALFHIRNNESFIST
jgi:hypothetical protein